MNSKTWKPRSGFRLGCLRVLGSSRFYSFSEGRGNLTGYRYTGVKRFLETSAIAVNSDAVAITTAYRKFWRLPLYWAREPEVHRRSETSRNARANGNSEVHFIGLYYTKA